MMRFFPGRNHTPRPRRADLHTLAGPYALNALPSRDRDRFERHLAACPACAEEVHGLRETTARLAAATAARPPERLKDKVFAEVARTRQLPPVTAGQPAAGRRRPGAGRWVAAVRRRVRSGRQPWARPVALIASSVFLVAAVVFGSMALITQHQLSQAQARDHMLAAVLTSPDARMMSVPVAGGGTATIVMSHMAHALAFSSANLPGLPAGKAYELWLMGPPGDRSAGMLPHAAHGMTAPVVATGLHAGDMVELTVEPAGGSARPTSAPILRMPL
ncbi:MAG TPA: anti-sigma factor [Streptosporangiaceae bacterium]|nr:anti-sigma factor [Streptosporangiaceae bacterium]